MENSPLPHFSTGLLSFYGIFFVIAVVGAWKTFEKAGKPGWACLIPIYNLIVLVEIIGKPVWWFLLLLIPCVNFVFLPWAYNLFSKSFGKGVGFTLGLIFLNPIFICILGFGDAVYLGPVAAEANAANRFGSADYQKPFDQNPQV